MYKGSCLCGAVHWEIKGDIIRTSNCWCTMCQKQHGAAFAPYANVLAADFSVTGADALKTYQSSPGVDRTFCGTCGSNLTWQMDGYREYVGVALGSFDTPYEGKVTKDLHIESKPGWLP